MVQGEAAAIKVTAKKFLNVGGNSKEIPVPAAYAGWTHMLLDIDPAGNPDIVCDARKLTTLPPGEFDAVYCSHNLEHYFRHDALHVLKGFLHVLKDDGFAHIIVPDVLEVMRRVVSSTMDIGDTLYQSPAGPITVRDVLYGHEKQIETSGQDFFAHKTGFSAATLKALLHQAGFPHVGIGTSPENFEILGIGFKSVPTEDAKKFFGMAG